jgi:deoxyribonuclease V
LKSLPVTPDIIIVDGYVWLDDDGRPGLGAKLYQALDRKTTIVGIAKTRFSSAPGVEVLRGKSTRPLYVTAAGLSEQMAADYLCEMHGKYRIPTILKRADQLARGNRHPVESRSGASRRSG